MTQITGNDSYTFANGILYQKNSDGTLTIIQCLPARGNVIKPATISVDTDPELAKVSAIAEGAFQNCDSISKVDLSAAKSLKVIPENCFNDCRSLRSVFLPESVNEILDGAFTSCGGSGVEDPITGKKDYYIAVDIPGREVHITYAAFDHNTGDIITYKEKNKQC